MNKDLIEKYGLPYLDNAVFIPTRINCIYPTKKDVFQLLTIEYLLATLAATDYDYNFFHFIYDNLNRMYKYDEFLNENDKILVNKLLENDLQINRDKLSWLYEKCFIYLWMLNLSDFPIQDSENNVKLLDDILFIQNDMERKINLPSKLHMKIFNSESECLEYDRMSMKSFDDILEKADLLSRMIWGMEELRINNKQINTSLNETVIRYQLSAFSEILNWDKSNPGVIKKVD